VVRTRVRFNPFQPGFAEDPYPHYADMRRADPVHRSPLQFWMLFRHDDVSRFLRDPSLSADDTNARPTRLSKVIDRAAPAGEPRQHKAMFNRDPPDHTRLRRLVTKAFTPRVIEALRPVIHDMVDGYLDDVEGTEPIDLIDCFAMPLPFAVISRMLGVPEDVGSGLREWSASIVRSLEPLVDPALISTTAEAGALMYDGIRDVIAWKRDHPADDLLSGLIRAESDGESLSDDELVEQVLMLYVGGHETTVNLIGNGTLALLRNPGQLRLLLDRPDLLGDAIDELLRYDSPIQMTRRVTLREVEVGGKVIGPGAFVSLGIGSANRDESVWGPTAEQLDITRSSAGLHHAFGGGVHYCLGAALARVEAHEAFTGLLGRFPRLALAGDPVWNGRINLRGLDHLPIVLDPRP
jgi:cytochrome P450